MKKQKREMYKEGIANGAKSLISIETANAYKKKLTNNNTKAENCIKLLLEEIKRRKHIQYKEQHIFYKSQGSYIIADFFLPKLNLVIEVDGEYHNTDEQRYKDSNRDTWLKMKNVKVLRITNKDAYAMSYDKLLSKLFPRKIKKFTPGTILTFGKHKNKTVEQISKMDPGYLLWMKKEGIAVFDNIPNLK